MEFDKPLDLAKQIATGTKEAVESSGKYYKPIHFDEETKEEGRDKFVADLADSIGKAGKKLEEQRAKEKDFFERYGKGERRPISQIMSLPDVNDTDS